MRERLANPGRKCFNHFIETGVLHEVGLRNTLEPDPDNTGVGSFRSRTALFLDSQLSSLVSWNLKQGESMFRVAVADSAHRPFQTHPFNIPGLFLSQAAAWRRTCALQATGLLLCWLAASFSAFAQSPAPAQDKQDPPAETPKPAPAAQKIPRVITTVVVNGETPDAYLPEAVTVGNLDGVPLEQTPLSATVVTRDLLTDQGARVLSDVVKNDASIGEDYAPVGYYGDFSIRGFPIDLATGMQINGMTIAGEQDVPLENKERVEFLKGIAGVESGVASAGGLINYETKRPAMVKAVDMATDHRGTAYGAVDLGHLFGSRKQVGARVNLAGEQIMSYVNDANGWRAMGAGAADWKFSPKAILKGDFEYQHKVERDGSGYQLLGGTVLPELDRVHPSTMLGEQSWVKPNTFDVFNTEARMDYDLPHAWRAFASASMSHSLIDDNVIYAYGTPFDAQGNVDCPGAPNAPSYFFCPAVPGITEGGDYAIYDYRNPGELRIDAQAEAMAAGHLKTGAIAHDLTAGGVVFLRSFQQPGAPPAGAPATVQNGSVYAYVGSENIYQANAAFPIESPLQSAGPRTLNEDNHQAAAVLQDRMHLPGHVQLLAAGRYDSVRDHNFGKAGTTDQSMWLPQYAASYNPVEDLTLYGNYSVLLSLGPQAPSWAGGYYMSPFHTRQAEVGAKYAPGQKILLTAALFRMRSPFFYPKDVGVGGNCLGTTTTASAPLCFLSEGRETHDGVEVNAAGKAASWMQLSASITAMRAISSDTGTPAFDNKQVINVPHLHTAFFADLALPHASGLHLMPGWSYTGRKEATRDDTVSVSSYNLFNLGARYAPGGEHGHLSLRLYADNIFNKRYWKDTGANYGDTYLWLGAPTTVRLSAHYTF
jgi:iron complex outermembrane receptor protein